ncbi:hypothetical protein HPB52_025695 [Rhipicephalus sanguineus]|uniref:Uncharacterized protein n=1 Tax=Rhipicephalus sanguineus TaxID=34632 RepID=A0A9D4TCS4_RHISA|nr:hypothetical protein HPB52_025695 [Rhipicephalus sanguineus]
MISSPDSMTRSGFNLTPSLEGTATHEVLPSTGSLDRESSSSTKDATWSSHGRTSLRPHSSEYTVGSWSVMALSDFSRRYTFIGVPDHSQIDHNDLVPGLNDEVGFQPEPIARGNSHTGGSALHGQFGSGVELEHQGRDLVQSRTELLETAYLRVYRGQLERHGLVGLLASGPEPDSQSRDSSDARSRLFQHF